QPRGPQTRSCSRVAPWAHRRFAFAERGEPPRRGTAWTASTRELGQFPLQSIADSRQLAAGLEPESSSALAFELLRSGWPCLHLPSASLATRRAGARPSLGRHATAPKP